MGASSNSEELARCAGCGASIYQEHIHRRLAGRWAGKLYCARCLDERQKAESDDKASLSLADEGEGADPSQRSSVMGQSGMHDSTAEEALYQRPLNMTEKGATRIRTFHARLSEAAIRNLDRQVNAWLDRQTDAEIKFATTNVATWEGKSNEPHLILTIYY